MKRANIVTIGDLFGGKSRYRCGPASPDAPQPDFPQAGFPQAGFHWEPPHVAQMLVDLEDAARESEDEDDVSEERFYLGVITVSPPKSGVSTIIDGQQRLVLISMFLAFARDRMPTNRERNRIDRVLVRRAWNRAPEPRLRLAPEDHAWFAHFILPPGATARLPQTAPLGSPRELLLAARFLEHAFTAYDLHDLRSIVDFLLHHTAVCRSLAPVQQQPEPYAPPLPALPAPTPHRNAWNDNSPVPSPYAVPQPAFTPAPKPAPVSAPAARYRVAAE